MLCGRGLGRRRLGGLEGCVKLGGGGGVRGEVGLGGGVGVDDSTGNDLFVVEYVQFFCSYYDRGGGVIPFWQTYSLRVGGGGATCGWVREVGLGRGYLST